MLMMVLCRFIGYTTGPASVAAIVQGNIKILLHKRITGPDADKVNKPSAIVTGYSNHACFIAHPIHSNINTQDLYIVSRTPSYCCRCARQSIAEDFLHDQCSYDACHMYLPFCQECQSQDCLPSMIISTAYFIGLMQ